MMDEKYASPLFSGGDAYQFDVQHDPFAKSAISVFQYLQGKVAGLNITTASSGWGTFCNLARWHTCFFLQRNAG